MKPLMLEKGQAGRFDDGYMYHIISYHIMSFSEMMFRITSLSLRAVVFSVYLLDPQGFYTFFPIHH